MQNIIEATGLNKKYNRSGRVFSAVDGIDFQLGSGEFVQITGRSGSGKSTLLGILAGMITPTAGKVLYDGEDIYRLTDEASSALRNTEIGYVPQSMGTMPNLSVLENVLLPRLFRPNRNGAQIGAEERAMLLLDRFGIAHLSAQFPRELSGGELRRVMIARAMMNEPRILMADEPTSDLDRENAARVMELFGKLNQDGVSLIVVTHEHDFFEYGNRTLALEDGKWVS